MAVLGMSEVKRKGLGSQVMNGNYVLRYSGVAMNDRAKEGVGFIVTEEMDKKATSWKEVSSRIITLSLDLETLITLIQVYAPTEDADLLEKEVFYAELQKQIDANESIGRRAIVMGDLNGRVGQDNYTNKGILGPYGGEEVVNTNGEKILDLCALNNLIVANSYYNTTNIREYIKSVLSLLKALASLTIS
ncbi:craniofacial development protein 2-like [Nilaparvata lugens]|uniref:craniofacial development protein 2-like n=1 Tax=Nilaparvata lugens TaxID=108931 RepID=UPI000B97CD6F|nr:craniofacial development protein 2-like [Nilaparvata lugens]